jgi:formylmethanofuran dehydrogenase subunit E
MARAKESFFSPSFQKCVQFHGHQCSGLAIGYRAARLAMDLLGVGPATDEELVAVVENDSCRVDAVQVITGCTLGKGNLIFKDYGKQAFTLGHRNSGKAVRVALRRGAFPSHQEHHELYEKLRTGTASGDEMERFRELQQQRTLYILEAEAESLFRIERLDYEFPEKARIMSSAPCARCGEPTMITKLEKSPNGLLCLACREASEKKSMGKSYHEGHI